MRGALASPPRADRRRTEPAGVRVRVRVRARARVRVRAHLFGRIDVARNQGGAEVGFVLARGRFCAGG